MSKKLISSSILSAIADFIRSKKGTQDTYKPTEFVEKINEVYDDKQPVLQTKSATPTTSSQEVTPDTGYDGLEKVTISAIQLQEKTVTPSLSYQDVLPDAGKDGLSKVRVNKINLQHATVKSKRDQDFYRYPEPGYDGLDYVVVQSDPVILQDKTVTPSGSQQVITPSLDYDGLGEVIIEAVSSDVDPYIKDYNIKNGVTILGVTGTYTGTNVNKASQILCRTATEIVLDDIAGLTIIYANQFYYFYSLTSLVLPDTLYEIRGDAFDLEALTSVYYNGTINYWLSITRGTGSSASVFNYNNANFYILDNNGNVNYDGHKYSLLTNLVLSNANPGRRCFSNYSALTNIDFSNFTGATISERAFYGCRGLTELTIKTIASPAYSFTIERGAFEYCSNLTKVTLDVIDGSYDLSAQYLFASCSSLTTFIIKNTRYPVNLSLSVNSFQQTPIAAGAGYIYVPDAAVNTYKNATGWSTYANQIKGLSELPQS